LERHEGGHPELEKAIPFWLREVIQEGRNEWKSRLAPILEVRILLSEGEQRKRKRCSDGRKVNETLWLAIVVRYANAAESSLIRTGYFFTDDTKVGKTRKGGSNTQRKNSLKRETNSRQAAVGQTARNSRKLRTITRRSRSRIMNAAEEYYVPPKRSPRETLKGILGGEEDARMGANQG